MREELIKNTRTWCLKCLKGKFPERLSCDYSEMEHYLLHVVSGYAGNDLTFKEGRDIIHKVVPDYILGKDKDPEDTDSLTEILVNEVLETRKELDEDGTFRDLHEFISLGFHYLYGRNDGLSGREIKLILDTAWERYKVLKYGE